MLRSPTTPALFAVLLALLAGCSRGEERPPEDTYDVLPVWRMGEVLSVREEREQRVGSGPFPTEGEILARTGLMTRTLRQYRVEILKADGPRLGKARFTYLTSAEGRTGELKPDRLAGNTYVVAQPFGNFIVAGVTGKGEPRRVEPAEAELVRSTALRMAGSLLPAGPVAVGSTWAPGRNLDVFVKLGRGPVKMVPRLRGITEREGHQYAEIGCLTEATVAQGKEQGAQLSMRETLFMDLNEARLTSYHAATEWRLPAATGRREEWRLFTIDLSVESR